MAQVTFRPSSFLSSIDSFQKISNEFLERGTDHGGMLTLTAYVFMAFLFIFEFGAFLSTETVTTVGLDKSKEQHIQINYDITVHEIPCDYVQVDVWDAFGNERMNITKDLTKFRLDNEGREQGVHHKDYHAIDHQQWEEYDKAHDDGDFTLQITEANFNKLANHDYTFINFYVPWCHWSRRLIPTWNAAAKSLEAIPFSEIGSDVVMVRINCQEFRNLCRRERVMAFPTMFLYKGTKKLESYRGDRTDDAMINWLKEKVHAHHVDNSASALGKEFTDHGCRLTGTLTVARVPGNFHLEAGSKIHNIDSTLTNVSHRVNTLSFGVPMEPHQVRRLPADEREQISPLNGNSFFVERFHQAPHHYLKVVSTEYLFGRYDILKSYQFTASNRIAEYKEDEVPEAKFTYDFSPVSVSVSQRGRPWYDFVTNLFAIVGGTYSVISLSDKMFSMASKRFKRRIAKLG